MAGDARGDEVTIYKPTITVNAHVNEPSEFRSHAATTNELDYEVLDLSDLASVTIFFGGTRQTQIDNLTSLARVVREALTRAQTRGL
jgi:hypothetical protein